jgi:hypothetical protein
MGKGDSASRNESGTQGHQSQGHQSQGHQSQGHQSQGHQSQGHQSQGKLDGLSGGTTGVVLRATIETFGPAGDAELNFTVKWPAAALGAAQNAATGGNTLQSGSDDDDDGDGSTGNSVDGTYDSDGNIHTPVSTPTGPVHQ